MPQRSRPLRLHPDPQHPLFNSHLSRNHYLRAQQAALSRDFKRFGMDEADDCQVKRTPGQLDYTKKEFKRAAEDLDACLGEALELFPQLDAEFTKETQEIRKYGDERLLNIIWEKKIQRFENGPRATKTSKTVNGHQQHNLQQQFSGNNQEESNTGAASTIGIQILQLRIQATIQSMLECQYPAPIEDDRGFPIHAEEIRDFQERIRKTAFRLQCSLGRISHNFQAFQRAIRDLRSMSQDLNLFPLNWWKADGQESEHQVDGY